MQIGTDVRGLGKTAGEHDLVTQIKQGMHAGRRYFGNVRATNTAASSSSKGRRGLERPTRSSYTVSLICLLASR